MSLFTQIQTQLPFATENHISDHINLIGNHFTTQMTALKLQRPLPAPTVVTPSTPIGMNYQTIISLLDAQIEIYNQTNTPKIEFNPWNDERFISHHILKTFIYAYEQNLISLIAYYAQPTGAVPPGYPTIPIPQPITIPLPAVPPLVNPALVLFFVTRLISAIPKTNPRIEINDKVLLFVQGWINFLLQEVFV